MKPTLFKYRVSIICKPFSLLSNHFTFPGNKLIGVMLMFILHVMRRRVREGRFVVIDVL